MLKLLGVRILVVVYCSHWTTTTRRLWALLPILNFDISANRRVVILPEVVEQLALRPRTRQGLFEWFRHPAFR
jgi:hypothetical protein